MTYRQAFHKEMDAKDMPAVLHEQAVKAFDVQYPGVLDRDIPDGTPPDLLIKRALERYAGLLGLN